MVTRNETVDWDWVNWGCYSGQGVVHDLGEFIPSSEVCRTETAPGQPSGCSQYIENGECLRYTFLEAQLRFPQCLAINVDTGNPIVSSDDLNERSSPAIEGFPWTAGDNVSHTFARLSWNPEGQYFCPDSHPYRIPQITYRIRYRIPGSENWGNLDNSPSTQGTQADTLSTYHLSCDDAPNRPDGPASQTRGWCLHGDWLGAWNDGVVSHWTDGCFQQDVQPAQNRVGMNCANGQTNTAFGLDLFEGSGVTDRTKYDGESRGWTQPIPAGGQ